MLGPTPAVSLASFSCVYRNTASSAASSPIDVCRCCPGGAFGSAKLLSRRFLEFSFSCLRSPNPPEKSFPLAFGWLVCSGVKLTVTSVCADWKCDNNLLNSLGFKINEMGINEASTVAFRCSASVTHCNP